GPAAFAARSRSGNVATVSVTRSACTQAAPSPRHATTTASANLRVSICGALREGGQKTAGPVGYRTGQASLLELDPGVEADGPRRHVLRLPHAECVLRAGLHLPVARVAHEGIDEPALARRVAQPEVGARIGVLLVARGVVEDAEPARRL